MYRIKTNKTWLQHPARNLGRARRLYYNRDRRRQYRKLIVIVWIVAIILVGQSIFQIKYLAISHLDLKGNEDLTIDNIQNTIGPDLVSSRFIFFKNNNFFLLQVKPLEKKLIVKYNLDQAKIKKVWPDKLEVTIKEKISHFVWLRDNNFYLLDASGFKIRPIDASNSKYLLIEDRRTNQADQAESEQPFAPEDIDHFNDIYLRWRDIITVNLLLKKIVVGDDKNLWELHTQPGFFIKFDPEQNTGEQLQKLYRILSSGQLGGQDLGYIDVRFGNKAYFFK